MRKTCKRDAGRGRASACTGLLLPRFVMSSRKETRVRYEVGRRDGVAGRPQDVGGRCGRATARGRPTFCFSIHAGTKSRRLNEACPFVLGGGRFFAGSG